MKKSQIQEIPETDILQAKTINEVSLMKHQKEYKSIEEFFEGKKITDNLVIPGVRDLDFAIKVSGNGMYPKYSNGDILACQIVRENFIQWGKMYVVATKSGLIVRKLKPSTKDNHIKLETCNNKEYPPFDVINRTAIKI